jgi:hypothetical protein
MIAPIEPPIKANRKSVFSDILLILFLELFIAFNLSTPYKIAIKIFIDIKYNSI